MKNREPVAFGGLRQEDIRDLSRVGKDTGLILGGSGFGRSLGLAFNFLAARVAGDVVFGLYTLAQTVANYLLTISTFGLDQALVRFVSIYRSRNDKPSLKGALLGGGAVSLALAAAGTVALLLLADQLSQALFHKPELAEVLRWFAWSIPFLTLFNLFLGATQGYRKMHLTPLLRDLAMPVSRLLLLSALFWGGWRLQALLVTHLGTAVIWGLVSLGLMIRVFGPVVSGVKAGSASETLRFGFPLFLNDLVMKSFRWSDVIFLGVFRGAGEIGIYRIAQITSEISRIIFRSFKTSFAPVIADLHQREDAAALKHQFMIISKWAFAVSFPPLVFFSLLAGETLEIFGGRFAAGALCLVMLNAGRMVSVSTGLVANMIVMSGRSRLTLVNSIAGNLLNFLLNALLIKPYGMVGAAAAYALSVSILNTLQMFQVRFIFGYFPYYAGFLKPLAASLLAGGVAKGAYVLLGLPPVAGVLVCAVLFLVLYIVSLLALGLPPEDRLLLRQLTRRLRPER